MAEEATGLLQISLEGDDVEPGKFPLRDLQSIGELTQHGVERMARVLLGEPGIAPGPLPEAVRRSTELLLVGIERGSAVARLELRSHGSEFAAEPSLLPPSAEDLGIRALDSFVSGLHSLEAAPQPVIPSNWDMSVMEIAEKLGIVAAERNIIMTLRSQSPQGEARVARIRPDEAKRYKVNHTWVRRRRSARGELIAIDLEKGNLAIKTERGPRVNCHFGESLLQQAKGLVGEVVVVSGQEEMDLASNRAGRLEVDSLEISTQQQLMGEDFWLNRSASEQAAEQGTQPLRSIADIAASDDFSDDDVAAFSSAMDELRSQQ